MLIRLKENMKFISKDASHEFTCKKWHFYGNEEIRCAFTEKEIYPLNELILEEYIPQVDDKWINEKNEYIY